MPTPQAGATPARSPSLGAALQALSVATEFAMAQQAHFGQRSAVLAVAMGRRLRWSDESLHHAHLQALLRYVGCNVQTQQMAALVGDELAIRREFAGIDMADKVEVARRLLRRLRRAHADENTLLAVLHIGRTLLGVEGEMARFFAGHCEVGQRLAARLALPAPVIESLGQLYERWDGKGLPDGLRGEAVAPPALLVSLAQDIVVQFDERGADGAVAMVRARRGGAHAPAMCDVFIGDSGALLAELAAVDADKGFMPWRDAVLEAPLGDAAFDAVCEALADFVDIKSPWTLSHSTGVARLAAAAAERLRLAPDEVQLVRRAGWLHDLGKVGVSAAVWGKPGLLSRNEQEQVRLHAYYSERILAAAPELAPIAEVASLAHDRLDGGGYFRRPPPAAIPRVARVLAAADVLHALGEARPQRPALPLGAAAQLLRAEVAAGRLDGAACEAVIAVAAGHAAPSSRGGALTEREVQVLRALARGGSMKEIARELGISPKTVDHHLQHIYPKVGVKTRAGATLYAMEQGLVATRF